MRQQGRLTEWNDGKGFGFVTSLDTESRVFVHISEFPSDKRRPIASDLVIYSLGQDEQGRPCAKEVAFLTPTRAAATPPKRIRITPALAAVLVAAAIALPVFAGLSQVGKTDPVASAPAQTDQAIASAFREQQSGIQVTGEGTVTRILSDDTDGSRHQRFILRLASGQTLLVAHNIDIAPRLNSLQVGDSVEFNGVYEWNDEGGVIHWTHHDPDGQHVPGWLRHNAEIYQ